MLTKFIILPDGLNSSNLMIINVDEIVKVEADDITRITLKDKTVEYTTYSVEEVYAAING